MPLPRRFLGDGEVVVLDLRPHWSSVVRPFVVLAAALALALFVQTQIGSGEGYKDFLLIPALTLVLVFLVRFTVRYARWASSNLVVTTHRVVIRSGVVARRGREVPLSEVRGVAVTRTLTGRLWGVGHIAVESSGGGSEMFSSCPRVLATRDAIEGLAAAAAGRSAGPAGAERSPLAQLEKLDDLRRRGVISHAEFEAKKAQLLDRL